MLKVKKMARDTKILSKLFSNFGFLWEESMCCGSFPRATNDKYKLIIIFLNKHHKDWGNCDKN